MLTDEKMLQGRRRLQLAGDSLKIADVVAAATRKSHVTLSDDSTVVERVSKAAEMVAGAVDKGDVVYGVTTGFGSMANEVVPRDLTAASQLNLLAFLATGAGDPIDRRHVRSAMILRANVLMQGCSGIRLEMIQRIIRFLQADAIPVVRELGSIGASGDLVPLSTIARAITGQSGFVKVQFGDETIDGASALKRLELDPIELLPKEGLAIVNGTSFSAAIAANAAHETKSLMGLALATQSMMLRALMAQDEPFEDFVHQRKPHPGQVWTARVMKRLLASEHKLTNGKATPVQDRYSLRCLPQYFGPIAEGIARVERVVETEMNAVSDNPLIDTENGKFYQSGNFLGQYVGVAMDDLRRFIGFMAKHLDVQIALLVAPEFSHGLTSSLRGNDDVPYHMGLKGLQIAGNSIMPMLSYLGNPLVEHSPTHAEQFNQNVNGLSWGAANLAWKSVEQFRHYMAISLIFAVQSLDLRAKSSFGHYDGRCALGSMAAPVYDAVCETLNYQPGRERPFLFNDADRWLENDLQQLAGNIADQGSLIAAVEPIIQSFDDAFAQR